MKACWKTHVLTASFLSGLMLLPSQGEAIGRDDLPPVTAILKDRSELFLGQGSIRISDAEDEIMFQIGHPPDGPLNTKRIRYKFEGHQSEWVYSKGEMRVGIRFYDQDGKFMGLAAFTSSGDSPGWKLTPDDSTFSRRRELIPIPPGVTSMETFMSSAGAPTVVGLYLVSDFQASVISKDKSIRPVMDAEAFLSGSSEDLPEDQQWVRDGNNPAMADLIQVGGDEIGTRVFSVRDDDPGAHGEWHQLQKTALNHQPGDQIILQWNEMFTIGDANFYYVRYPKIPPGTYRFRVNELDTLGIPTSRETVVETTVLPPLWKNPWVGLIAICTLLPVLFFGIRSLIRIKIRRRLERIEKKHAVERERLRIARDIHDDLGARLTHISLVSGMAENSADTMDDRGKFKEISDMARELVFAMYETVWTVNPQNDDLESLVSFVCQSTENLCKPSGIRCRINATTLSTNREVRSEIRHNVILAVKEAIHNAIKHSQASEIELRISFDSPRLLIEVSDNGRGFDLERHKGGHGLKNLERRMETIGGKVSLDSSTNDGARVHFTVPIP